MYIYNKIYIIIYTLLHSIIITQPTNALIVCNLFLNLFFKTLSLLLHVSIAYHLSSSGSTCSSYLKSRVKIMNFFVTILLWQHIMYLFTSFLVQGGKWTHLESTCLHARETTYTNNDMLAQQYYNEKVHIFNT